MADVAHHSPGINGSKPPVPTPAKPFTPEDEAALIEALKRCSPATVEAAVKFRKTGDPACVPAVVIGVIERFAEPDQRAKLREADDDLRLIEDLGIDSLTMMEIVILVEDTLQMSINNDELRHLRTLGDIKIFIDCKVRGLAPPKPSRFLPIEHIGAVMPIQPPFLFLNEATVGSNGASAKYKITGDELFLKGHFKDNPVMPASIMLEAIGQLAVLFLLEGGHGEEGKQADPQTIYFTGCEGVRAHRVCKPGDTLSISIKPKRLKMPLATFEGQIRVGQEKAAFAEEITLTYGLRDVVVAPQAAAVSAVPAIPAAAAASIPATAARAIVPAPVA
ncbi:MAG TPA: phosphopantetheine-binding protein [Opitutaceae bacterium]|jgi:acyl carrier protein|nr:phosphopantetheine-binding protein [Opitutaceae bacterium]